MRHQPVELPMRVTREEFKRARIVSRRATDNSPAWRYRVVNGTLYDPTTRFEVVAMLELARHRERKIVVHYGITEALAGPRPSHFVRPGGYINSRDIGVGFVRQLDGRIKSPILVADAQGTHGDAIRDDQIVAIWPASPDDGGEIVFCHPGYGPLPVE